MVIRLDIMEGLVGSEELFEFFAARGDGGGKDRKGEAAALIPDAKAFSLRSQALLFTQI